jgi:broad specificity phosphatase PhoE
MTLDSRLTTRLIVVRHGQTACNLENIWHGWDECSLTNEGLAQAEAAGRRLATEEIAAVYSSPSRRAWQTAEAVARRHGLEPIAEPGLRERNAGEYEGVAVADVVVRNPRIWEERAADYWSWRPPGGESFREVLARTMDVVERVRAEHEGETAVLVTHMGPARVLISALGGIPMEETYAMDFPSTGVSIFELDEAGSRTESINDAGHIAAPLENEEKKEDVSRAERPDSRPAAEGA